MLCPVCKVTLTLSERQGIEIDYCPQCRGIWLDRGELDKLIERSEAQVAAAPVAASHPLGEREHRDDYRDGRRADFREKEYREKEYRDKHSRPDDKHGYGHYPRRKKSFLGELLDFD